jgi:phosphatidylglycerophosphate synthase
MSGRKIPREHENPIDNLLIDISQDVGKVLHPYPIFTPNFLTTVSLVVALFAVYMLKEKNYKVSSILLFVSYFFDCLDGNFARTYNMETDFGDKYDHFSDAFKIVAVAYVIVLSSLRYNTKFWFAVVYLVIMFFSFVQIGCQEVAHGGNHSSSLSLFKSLCFSDQQIMWARYLGCGTGQLIVCIIIYNLKWLNKRL